MAKTRRPRARPRGAPPWESARGGAPGFSRARARPQRPPRACDLLVAAVLAAAVVLVYAPVVQHDWINFDEPSYVYENAWVLEGLSRRSISWAFGTHAMGSWEPLSWLSHMLDSSLFGAASGPRRGVQVALHALNTVLLFALWRRMTGALVRSALVSGFFALHPLHVESVAWLAQRKDLLCGLFSLLALHAWTTSCARSSRAAYALSFSSCAAALSAKPMAVTLPFVMLLLDAWPLRRLDLSRADFARSLSRRATEKLPLFALSGFVSAVTLVAQREAGATAFGASLDLPLRFANAAVAYASYLRRMLWPSDLAPFYPYPTELLATSSGLLRVSLSLLLLAFLSVTALRLARRVPALAVGWLWFLGTLVPVIGLVQVGAQAMADRYTYFPLIGLYVALVFGLAAGLERAKAPRALATGLALALLLGCGVVTARQRALWRDPVTLYRHTLDVAGPSAFVHNQLGLTLQRRSDDAGAVAAFERATRLDPGHAAAWGNLGNARAAQSNLAAAEAAYEEAIRFAPADADAYANLGLVLARAGRWDEAAARFERALALRPDHAVAREALRRVRLGSGKSASGIDRHPPQPPRF